MDWFQKRWLAKYTILTIIWAYVIVGCGIPQPAPVSSSDFNYLVRVRSTDTNKDISNAEVTIEVKGKVPLDNITDVNGIAVIAIGTDHAGQLGVLIVQADGFNEYRQNINLIMNELPDVVRLEPKNDIAPTPTPTEELTVEPNSEPTIDTPTPVVEPTTTTTPTIELTTFDYQIRIQAKDTEEYILDARVKLEIKGSLSLDDKSDINGLAKISFDSSQTGQPAILTIEASGYKRYQQNIEGLSINALPDIIQLEPDTLPPFEYEIQIKDESTNENVQDAVVTLQINDQSVFTGTTDLSGTIIMTIEAIYKGQNGEIVIEVPGYQIYKETIELDEAAFIDPIQLEKLPPSPPPVTGKLAIPLILDGKPEVQVVDVIGNLLNTIDMARQPNYSREGTKLIVNGDGGPLDKLRVVEQIANQWYEIGDPGLAGHSHPAWSPDGTQVVYDDSNIFPGSWFMFVRDLNKIDGPGDELKAITGRITDPNSLHPLWTTRNRFIFRGCSTWDISQTGNCGIWVIQGNNGTPQRLTDNFNHIPTDVHDDTVVYVSNQVSGNDWNVYTLNISTGNSKQLTFDPAAESLATISPDGSYVAFLSNKDGGLSVWYIRINGGNTKKMFDIPSQWGGLDPNGWSDEKLSWGID